MKQQLERLEKELNAALTVRHMTEKHPVVVALRKQIEDTKKSIERVSAKSAPQSPVPLDATTQGKTYYVDRNCAGASDSNPGTEAQPFLTVQRGVDLAQPGDTVLVKGSTDPNSPNAVYSVVGNGITTRRAGLAGSLITIAAYPDHKVIIRGNGSGHGVNLDYGSYHVLRGLVFQNFNKAAEGFAPKTDILIDRCEFTQTYETGLRLRYVTNFTMRDCYVHNCFEAGISVRDSTNVTFERVESSYNDDGRGGDGDADGFHSIACGTMNFIDCVARGNAEDGFDLNANATLVNCIGDNNNICNVKLWRRTEDGYAEHASTITNSVFYGGSEAGIKVSVGAELHLYNSVVYGNGDEGVAFRAISITQGPQTVTSVITNNIIAKNGYGAIEVLQSGAGLPKNDVQADHNLYYTNGRTNVGLSSDTNFITGQDPLFFAPAAGDFHLRAGSPAIDKAIPLAAVTYDFDHETRPNGPAPDIGADEFGPWNHPPVANNDSFTVLQDSGANVLDVLANDSDPDGDALSIIGTTNPAHGTVAILGGGTRLSYAPNAGFWGADTFTYTVTDGHGGTASATVAIAVTSLGPVLSVSPVSLDFARTATSLTFTIRNAGQGTLSYNISVSAGASWLAASPVSGTCSTETDTITVTVVRGSLPPGHYTATITVDGGTSGTQDVAVSMDVPAPGKTYYVDRNRPGASDSNPGTEDQPFLTVQRGVDLAQPGDTVLVKGSTDPNSPNAVYSVAGNGITTQRPGLSGSPITIAAYPGHTVIMQGSGGKYGIDLTNASYHVFRGLIFRNYEKAAESFAVNTDILIEQCEFSNASVKGLSFRNITNLTVRDTQVHDCFDNGVDLRNCHNVTLERVVASNNVTGEGDGFHSLTSDNVNLIDCVARNNLDGFDLNSNSTLTNVVGDSNQVCNVKLWRRADDNYAPKTYTIVNSVFYGAGEAGIKVSAGAQLYLYNSDVYGNAEQGVWFTGIGHAVGPATVSSKISNCIIAENGDAWAQGGIDVDQSGPNVNKVDADHNLYFNNHGVNSGLSSDTNFITGQDPLFFAPAAGDFHLRAGSPAIDKAIPLAAVTYDFDHETRPNGPAPDIGADEFGPGNRPPVANNDSFTVPQDSGANVLDVLANDSDPDGDALSIIGTTNPAHGTVAILGGGTRLSYAPNAGFSGADTFTYTISDGHGGTASATVAIAVTSLGPILSVSPTSLDFGRTVPSRTFTIRNTGQGTLSYNISVSAGASWLAASPVTGTCTTETDTITVTVARGSLAPGRYTATITVNGGIGGTQNVAVSVDVPLIAQRVLVEAGDDWRYLEGDFTPDPPWYGEWAAPEFDDSDWLTGPTGIGTPGSNVVYVTELVDMPGNYTAFYARKVFQVADPTALQQLQLEAAYDDGFVAYLNGTEVARANLGQANSPVWVFTPADGVHEATQQPTEVFPIDPALVVAGENVLAIEVHNVSLVDLDAGVIPRLTATVLDLPPVAHDDTFTVIENSVGNILNVLANDTDPDTADVLTVVGKTAAAHGTAAILAGGTAMTYTPNSGYTGPDSFTYTISDSCGATATATVNITVQLDTPRVVAVTLNGRADRGPSAIDPSGAGARTIAIRFNKPVTVETGVQGQATGGPKPLALTVPIVLEAVAFPNGAEQVIRPLTPQTIAGSGTDVLTITLAMASAVDTWVKVTIAGDGSIHDAAGQAVDGEPRAGGTGHAYIFDASQDLPSGDGVPDTDAVFYVGSLRGDFNGDRSVGPDDIAGFEAAWQAKSLDADFRGVGLGVSAPDGRVTDSDVSGFRAVYKAAMSTARHLDPLPGPVVP